MFGIFQQRRSRIIQHRSRHAEKVPMILVKVSRWFWAMKVKNLLYMIRPSRRGERKSSSQRTYCKMKAREV